MLDIFSMKERAGGNWDRILGLGLKRNCLTVAMMLALASSDAVAATVDGANANRSTGGAGGTGSQGTVGSGGNGSFYESTPQTGGGSFGGGVGTPSSGGIGAMGAGDGATGGGGGGGVGSGGGGGTVNGNYDSLVSGGGGGGGATGLYLTGSGQVLSTTGGNGGNGADASGEGGYGGGGGGGGLGVNLTGSFTMAADISVLGGNGGYGGRGRDAALFLVYEWGGGGGGAGAGGISLNYNAFLDSLGTITGGRGGDGGVSISAKGAAGGTGGNGVSFSSAEVINRGTVTGGAGGNGGDADGNIAPTTKPGGNGAAGGAGARAYFGTLTNIGTLTGGAGGTGGSSRGHGGLGANGGSGVVLTGGGSILNQGAITGGQGGNGGNSTIENGGDAGNAGSGVHIENGTLVNEGTIFGGKGGTGGQTSEEVGLQTMGGNGGNGGVGAFGLNSTLTNRSGHSITGGNGGNVGLAGLDAESDAGDGGWGVEMSGGTLVNEGTITGGNGGFGLSGEPDDMAGSGGSGVTASNASIVNSGTISGGFGGPTGARANAITFREGTNTLELRAGSAINGAVVGTGNDTLILGGSADASFSISSLSSFTGFSTFKKEGSSAWTFTGSTTSAYQLRVLQGQVTAESAAALGTGRIVVDGSLDGSAELSIGSLPGAPVSETQIVLNNGAKLVNLGTLRGDTEAADGPHAVVVSEEGGATVTNYGTIGKTNGLVAGVYLGGGGTVDNFGKIEAVGDASGVRANGTATITNHEDATISGGLHLLAGGTVTNNGTLTGESLAVIYSQGASTDVVNTGEISGAGITGVRLSDGGTLTNSGTIEARRGVEVYRGGSITNEFGAMIISESGYRAVEMSDGVISLTNAGAIYGDILISGASQATVTLDSWGTIQGWLEINHNTSAELILAGEALPSDDTSIYSEAVTGQTFFEGTLRKIGSRTWELDRNLGATVTKVEEGTLILSATLGGSSVEVEQGAVLEMDAGGVIGSSASVTVAGTLRGEGTIKGETVISGTLSPTGSPSSGLTFDGAVSLTSDATTVLVISPQVEGGSTNTWISANAMTLDGELRLVLSGLMIEQEGQWTLFDVNTFAGSFDTVRLLGEYQLTLHRDAEIWSGTGGGYNWRFDQSNGVLSTEAVPEPSTWALIGLALGALLWRLARRNPYCLSR